MPLLNSPGRDPAVILSGLSRVQDVILPSISSSIITNDTQSLANGGQQQANFAQHNCTDQERAYLAIIITVLPLWGIITSLIVFILLSFHKSLRVTKIYDNCNKNAAQFAYFIEIRTGDTSATFNRRRTTLTIDMFDDNQATLARLAIPCHIIFGRKEMPIGTIEDEKYFELRVTRFWLYRATKLKRVSTIRLTHSCLEPDAKIMVYGVEIRSGERDKHKLFFPVLSYISAFGSTRQPNACFDLETSGSISVMGGSQAEQSVISNQLSWVDFTILFYLLGALMFYITSSEHLLHDSFTNSTQAIYKGTIAGLVAYVLVFCIGLVLRFIIKHNYSLGIGSGAWAIVYYGCCLLILSISTFIWIYTTVLSYKLMCPSYYGLWILSLSLATVVVVVLGILNVFAEWVIHLLSPRNNDYLLPDEAGTYQEQGSKSQPYNRPGYQQQSKQTIGGQSLPGGMHQQPWHMQAAGTSTTPVQIIYPGQTVQTSSYHASPPPSAPAVGYGAQSPQGIMSPMLASAYKTPIFSQTPTMVTFDTGSHLPAATHHSSQPQQYSPVAQQNQQQQQTYNQQINLQGITRTPRKVGSNESTGSTYYHQLMKNRGGVKSISQYGELLKQKKAAKLPAAK